jgi:putative endonuclease
MPIRHLKFLARFLHYARRMNTTDFGNGIEHWAADWFQKNRQAQILHRNYRCRMGELDLIAQEGRELVFIEVRARTNPQVSPIESIDFKKRRKIRLTIDYFLQRYRGDARTLRLDVLAWDGQKFTHFPNVDLRATS